MNKEAIYTVIIQQIIHYRNEADRCTRESYGWGIAALLSAAFLVATMILLP